MDKLKNLLKSDTPTDSNTGEYSTGSASAPDAKTAFGTAGSQANTASSKSAVANEPFPTTNEDGTAAIGHTSTYSSSHLSRGDPTPSVIDPYSSDPLTYKKPEASVASNAGVAPGAAQTAAARAFAAGEARTREATAGYENPYRASSLDPRVDGGSAMPDVQQRTGIPSPTPVPATSASTSTNTAILPDRSVEQDASTTRALDTEPRTGVPPPSALSTTSPTSVPSGTAPAPSSLTTTVDPIDRSAEYGASTESKGLDNSASASTGTVTNTSTTEAPVHQSSMVGRALGAVGLGSVAGAIGYGTGSAVADTPDQPTTTTGVGSYTAPTESGPQVGHHRKESIPTTAYPSGTFDSPRAINQPIGGSAVPVIHSDTSGSDHRHGSGVAAAATGATAVGAAAVGAHEYERSRDVRENIAGAPSTAAQTGTPRTGGAVTGVSSEHYDESRRARDGALGVASAGAATGAPAASTSQAVIDYPSSVYHAATSTTTGTTSEGLADTSVGTGLATTSATAGTAGEGLTSTHAGTGLTATSADESARRVSNSRDLVSSPTFVGATSVATGAGAGTYAAHESGQPGSQPNVAGIPTLTSAGTDASVAQPTTSTPVTTEDHSKRDAALGGAAGAAAVGVGAHEYSKREAEKAEEEAARRQSALEKERKEAQKQAEKDEKHHQKELEKEQKQHQKELEKEEKHHQKELEKQHKKEQEAAEVAALKERRQREEEEARQRKQLEEEAEQRKIREERERLAGAAGIGAGAGAGVAATEEEKHKEQEEPKEKKPSFFRRIFKRRKNKDTGADEDYSTDEEDSTHHGRDAAVGGAAVGAAGTAAAQKEHQGTGHSYEEVSGGTTKPSYNPFNHEKPVAVGTEAGPTTAIATDAGQEPRESITGLPYDPAKDPETAARLAEHQHGLAGAAPGGGDPEAYNATGENVLHIGEGAAARDIDLDFKLGEFGDTRR